MGVVNSQCAHIFVVFSSIFFWRFDLCLISFDISFVSVCFDGCVAVAVAVICCQCVSCCAGDIWEKSVGCGKNGGGGGRVCDGLCSRFCGDGPLF